jgi:hypothetical protein
MSVHAQPIPTLIPCSLSSLLCFTWLCVFPGLGRGWESKGQGLWPPPSVCLNIHPKTHRHPVQSQYFTLRDDEAGEGERGLCAVSGFIGYKRVIPF